jgi:hypothetical protein
MPASRRHDYPVTLTPIDTTRTRHAFGKRRSRERLQQKYFNSPRSRSLQPLEEFP